MANATEMRPIMDPIVLIDSEPNVVKLKFYGGLVALALGLYFAGEMPFWVGLVFYVIVFQAVAVFFRTIPLVGIQINMKSVSISNDIFGIFSKEIPCSKITAVYTSRTPAVQIVQGRLGVHGLARASGSGVRKRKWKYYLGSKNAQTLLIDTTTFKYILSCRDAYAAASAIRQNCGLAETTVDAEEFLDESFPESKATRDLLCGEPKGGNGRPSKGNAKVAS